MDVAMTPEAIASLLREHAGESVSEIHEALDPFVVVTPSALIDVCSLLRDTASLQMDFLQDETATDHPDEGLIRVVYHLFSYPHRHGIVLKVEVPRDDPRVPTLERLWPVANWFEREIHDLFGVVFEGHSDLRPLMLPDDWEGHPLRKDYVEPERYHGIEHQRFSPIEGFGRLDALARAAAAPPPEAETEGEAPA
jgi:NADH-quinone oxidoreductase subunit C